MNPVVRLKNLAQFQATMRQAAARTSRTVEQFTVGQAFGLALNAVRLTKRASPEKISRDLGVIGTEVKVRKSGKNKGRFVKGKMRLQNNFYGFAARIINARRRREGKQPIWGEALTDAARKLINARRRAVGFIASGWLWAVKTLSKRVKSAAAGGISRFGVKAGGNAKGYARLHLMRGLTSVQMANTALMVKGGPSPIPIGEAGLDAALAESTRDTEAHLQRKVQAALDGRGG